MREISSDPLNATVTYELADGRCVRLDQRAVREYGAARIIRDMGYGHLLPTERVVLMHDGMRVGTLPPDFDPASLKSNSFMYEPRRGDFVRDGDVWIAARTLGPGDLDAVPGFVRDLRKSS